MSRGIISKFWHLNNYFYIFYRFLVEKYCQQHYQGYNLCLMLDAGCGPNLCSISNVPENVFVVGVDINSHNVANSHGKANKSDFKNFTYVLSSITSLPFRGSTFDLAISVDVLEHINNKLKSLCEISFVLRSKGKIIGSTTNLLNPILMFDSIVPKFIVKILEKRFTGDHYERHSRFSYSRLMYVLNRANFQDCEAKLLGFPLFKAWLYEYYEKKLPLYAYFWIFLNRLTDKKPLYFLKEEIVFRATKKC